MRERLIFVVLMSLFLLVGNAGLAFADDPGIPDTCRVGCLDVIQPGQQVVVEVSVFNDEALGGLAVPLVFGRSPFDVVCDSISFVGTRIIVNPDSMYVGTNIDNANYKLLFYAIYTLSNLPPGDGVVANLYFTTGPNWDSTLCVHLDTTFFPPTTRLEFTPRASGQALRPKFIRGCLSSGVALAPALIYPSDQADVCSPDTFNLFWSKSGVDLSYTLQYAQDSAFTTGLVTVSALADTHYSVSLPRLTYYWHVKSASQCGKESGYQDPPNRFHVFLIGDATSDGVVEIGDVLHLINYLYKAGSAPNPMQSGDVTHDDIIDVEDLLYILNYLFRGQSAPKCP